MKPAETLTCWHCVYVWKNKWVGSYQTVEGKLVIENNKRQKVFFVTPDSKTLLESFEKNEKVNLVILATRLNKFYCDKKLTPLITSIDFHLEWFNKRISEWTEKDLTPIS